MVDNFEFMSLTFKRTYIYSRTVLTTSTFSPWRVQWDVASFALPDTNNNFEKKTMKHILVQIL